MKKGTILISNKTEQIYQIVGRWDSWIVLMPVYEVDDQLLVYEPGELEGLIKEGLFRKLHKIPTRVGEKL